MFHIYKNKKVLITGHTGFKGSWLSLWLFYLGAKVVGYALNPKTSNDNFTLLKLNKKINDYRGDIRDKERLFNVFEKEKPEIIFHLAAQPLVLKSFNDPIYTIETNTMGTANILEAFRQSDSAKILIVITTDKVYYNNEWDWGYRENDRLGGKDIYSASKAASEILIESYREAFFNNLSNKLVASVRAGNVIGGGDWSEYRIIPDCIKAIESNKEIQIRNPKSVRPWQHILEPLSGYLLLGYYLINNKSEFADAWNFGPFVENFITVENLVTTLINKFGKGKYIINSQKNNKESKFLSLDISKAIKKLKWRPVLNFDETIEFTVEWYKNYKAKNVFDMCINQIKRYETKWKSKNVDLMEFLK